MLVAVAGTRRARFCPSKEAVVVVVLVRLPPRWWWASPADGLMPPY